MDKGKSLKWSIVLLLISVICFFMSVLFLPVIVVSPHKFAFLFTCGSITALASMACYHGPGTYVGKLFGKDKCIFTVCYIASLIITLWCSLIMDSYILTLIACIG